MNKTQDFYSKQTTTYLWDVLKASSKKAARLRVQRADTSGSVGKRAAIKRRKLSAEIGEQLLLQKNIRSVLESRGENA